MRGAGGAENRRVTLEEAPTPLCCNPLHPARPRNPTREGGGFLYLYGTDPLLQQRRVCWDTL